MIYYFKTNEGYVLETNDPTRWDTDPELTRIKRGEAEHLQREWAKVKLHEILNPGATIYQVVRHVSGSGMRREISSFAVHNGELVRLDYYIKCLTGRRLGKHDGIVCDGCGMDMGYDLVYKIGCYLYPQGTGGEHNHGGYALNQRWM